MQILITGQNIEITSAIKTFTTDKFQPFEKRYHQINKINITLHVEHIMKIAVAIIHMGNTEIHAMAKNEDMYKAIDMLEEKLQTQLTKHKEKLIESHR